MNAIRYVKGKKHRLADSLKLNEEVTPSHVLDFLEAIDSPYGLSVAIKLRYEDYLGVLNTEVNPRDFNDVNSFSDAYQSVKVLSKFPHLPSGIDLEQVAYESFKKAEAICESTNDRLRQNRADNGKSVRPAVNAIISLAQRKIARVLGRLDLSEISRYFDWGPGATVGVTGNDTSAYNKFSGPLDVTSNCLTIGLCCINSSPSWANFVCKTHEVPSLPVSVLPSTLKVVNGNEIIFVPKNAKTHRVIAKEPSLNIYAQKGVGGFLKRRLRCFAGVDLEDQSRNQSLAEVGSRTGLLATIDLSMASDTVSYELVRELLPEEWFQFLCMLRSEYGTIKKTKETVRFHKFSSMGNGFTFELESLIFWALARATYDQHGEVRADSELNSVSVYGDDLIVPKECYEPLIEVLEFCGFSTNKLKSFNDGAFRESCGKDFFLGTPVRPLFLQERIDNVEALYRMANSVRRYAHSRNQLAGCDRRFHRCWELLVSRIPRAFRFYQPEGYGDQGIISNFDEARPTVPRDGWEGYFFRVVLRVPFRKRFIDEECGYLTTLHGAPRRSTHIYYLDGNNTHLDLADILQGSEFTPMNGGYSPRSRTYPKIGRVLASTWYNLGPWC